MKTKLLATLPWSIALIAVSFWATNALANESRRYNKPMHQNYRLDWCLTWGKDCGEPAASAWCRARGYQRAKRFQIAKDIGAGAPTKVLRTGQICKKGYCDGFSFILCERAEKSSSPGKPDKGFTGSWQNVDADNRSISRIEIKPAGGKRFSVQVWGKCRPKECDWGKRTAVRRGNRLVASWDQGFVQRKMVLAREGDRLSVTTRSDYRDKRPDRVSQDEFKRPGLLIAKRIPFIIKPTLDPEGWIKRGSDQLSDYGTPKPQRETNARASFDRAMNTAKGTKDRKKIRDTALQIAELYLGHQMAEAAKGYVSQAVQAYRETGDSRGLARTLLAIASLYTNSWQDPDERTAERSARRALSIYKRMGDEPGQAAAIHQLGFTALRWHKPPQALEHFQQALELRRQTGDRRGAAQSLLGVAASYEKMARGKLSGWPDPNRPIYQDLALTERALEALQQALEILRETGSRAGIWRVLFNLGAIHENRGEDEPALAYYREALEASTAANERRAAEHQLACDTDLGRRLSDEFINRNLQCPMAAFGSTSILFDDEDEWDEW